jgi:hypothetical protein
MLTEAQQNKVDTFKRQWAAAQARGDTAAMNLAHQGAESVRAHDGYLGGADGSLTKEQFYNSLANNGTGTSSTNTTGFSQLPYYGGTAKTSTLPNYGGTSASTPFSYLNSPTYNQSTDYQALINTEKAKGAYADQTLIDQYNRQRDAKINAMAISSSSGSLSTGTNTSNGLRSANSKAGYIDQLYAAQQQAKLDALKSAYDANTADLNNTAAKLPDTYNTARNTTAAASAVNQSSFNERAAANGLNSGTGGQAALSMANTLQSNLSSLDSEQASKLADIDTQRAKLASQYNNAIQQAIEDNDSEKAQALYNEAVRIDNSLVSTSQAQASFDLQKQAAQTSASNMTYEERLAKAETLRQYGNFTGYLDLGYSQDDVDSMKAAYDAEKTGKTASSTSSTRKLDGTLNNNVLTAALNGVTASSKPNYGSSAVLTVNILSDNGYSQAQISNILSQSYKNGELNKSDYGALVDANLRNH